MQYFRKAIVNRTSGYLLKINLCPSITGTQMKPIKLALFTLFFIFQFGISAHALTMSECNAFASKLNKEFPQQADAVTTVLHAKCEGSDPIYLVYSMQVETALTKFTSTHIHTLRQNQIAFWCSSPGQYNLLKRVGIRYTYISTDKRYLGQTSFTVNDCLSSNNTSLGNGPLKRGGLPETMIKSVRIVQLS